MICSILIKFVRLLDLRFLTIAQFGGIIVLIEQFHLMENLIYNELIYIGYDVIIIKEMLSFLFKLFSLNIRK